MSSSKNPLSLNSMCRQKSWWGGEKADIGSGLSDLHAEMRSPGTQRAWQELVIAHNDRRCCRLFLGIHLALVMVAAPFVTRRQSNRFFKGNMVLQRNVRVAADSWPLDVHFQGLLMRIRQNAMRLAKTHQPHRSD